MNMDDLTLTRLCLEEELHHLQAEETKIDGELSQYFNLIAGTTKKSSNKTKLSFDSLDISSSVEKLATYGATFEAMEEDSKKLVSQVEDCRALSDKLSSIVRRLDTMQIRAQQTLACTEDIINLKDCKAKIVSAIEARNLSLAVGYLRQVHEIEIAAAESSEDYAVIKEKEQEVKKMVQEEFANAIKDSDIKSVMTLCPLLQTLGLESEARDTFLDFVETTVFIALSADASSVEGATDPATAYAKSLSNVFNSAYIIIQQYLPMVIQGMENSLGDVYFIRRLHRKCEQELGMVLKRYMKFRNIRDVIGNIRGTATAGTSLTKASQVMPAANMHTLMDELALLIQYCCRYSKYISHICAGAESKTRLHVVEGAATVNAQSSSSSSSSPSSSSSSSSSKTAGADTTATPSGATTSPATPVVLVFTGPSAFDKMVDELINKYYMEGEQWLMRTGVARALQVPPQWGATDGSSSGAAVGSGGAAGGSGGGGGGAHDVGGGGGGDGGSGDVGSGDGIGGGAGGGATAAAAAAGMDEGESMQLGLDECFFMLRKCGMRAVATNNIHAACAVLHVISDLLATELLQQANALLNLAVTRVSSVMQAHIAQFKIGMTSGGGSGGGASSSNENEQSSTSASSSSMGTLRNVFFAGADVATTSTGSAIRVEEEGGFSLTYDDGSSSGSSSNSSNSSSYRNHSNHARDPWRVSHLNETFNLIELCVRYTERLNNDIVGAGSTVFSSDSSSSSSASSSSSSASASASTSEMEKLKLCKEDFEVAKISFSNALRQSSEKLISVAQILIKDIFHMTIGRHAPMGGIKFDEPDNTFDAQPALNLLPRLLILPLETLVNICTVGLSERNKDMMVGLLAGACCERLEHFITQTTFRFPGALKLEEIVRALSAMLSRHSSIPIRGYFSRLREVLLVLTTDLSTTTGGITASVIAEGFSQLTASEVDAFISLRVDAASNQPQPQQQ